VTAQESIHKAEIDVLSHKMQTLASTADRAIADANVKTLSEQAVSLIEDLRKSNSHLQALLASPDTQETLDNIPVVVDEFSRTLNSLDNLLKSKEPEVEQILENLRQLSQNLNYLSERLKDNPSELLFSQPPQKQEN
jgi:phospholipid/cholesterol/gamma-HCH transport system substrate-binding protein/paraquat-inducible protein B